MRWLPILLPALLALAAAAQAPAPAPTALPPDDQAAAGLIRSLATNDAAAAARAEAGLVVMGHRATGAIVAYMQGESRDSRAVASILRVIARVKDPDGMKALWTVWDGEPASRDLLIEAWAAYGDNCVSPLAGYFSTATDPQRESILDALGAAGDLAVPALTGIAMALSNEQGGIVERMSARVADLMQRAPVVTLARKGPVALRDLEAMAGDPSTPPVRRDEAIRRIVGMASKSDEAALALQRLASLPATAEARALLEPASDEARLLMLSRKGEASIDQYAAILRDPSAREALKMGAANGLFGLGAPALPVLRTLAAQTPPGSLADYLRQLAAALDTQTAPAGAGSAAASPAGAIAGPPASGSPAPPASATDDTCVGEPALKLVARVNARRLPISPRWFARSPDAARVAYTTSESGLYRIVVTNPEGDAARVLAPLAHQFAPSWSWNGKRLAFLGVKNAAGNPVELNDVYLADPDGSRLRKVTQMPGAHASPVWLTSREEILYAANRLPVPGEAGSVTDALLFRFGEATGEARPIVSLRSSIITAIEPSPDFRRLAFLSRKIEEGRASGLSLNVCDTDGQGLLTMPLVAAAHLEQDGKRVTAADSLALGGDLTWSPDGKRVAAAGRVIDVAAWRVETRIDPGDDRYAARTGSRTILAGDPWCGYFDDTRQISRRCPPDSLPEILADCHGALLWLDEKAQRLALFDPFNGSFGYVAIRPPPSPQARPAPAQRRRDLATPGRPQIP